MFLFESVMSSGLNCPFFLKNPCTDCFFCYFFDTSIRSVGPIEPCYERFLDEPLQHELSNLRPSRRWHLCVPLHYSGSVQRCLRKLRESELLGPRGEAHHGRNQGLFGRLAADSVRKRRSFSTPRDANGCVE